MTDISRRKFLQTVVGTIAGSTLLGTLAGCRRQQKASATTNIEGLVREAIDGVGGMSSFVKKGQIVAVKPNASFGQPPSVGATTHPEVVAAVVKLALEAGAKEVRVLDHSLHEPHIAFMRNGIKQAVEDAGGVMPYLTNASLFKEQAIAKGKMIKTHKVLSAYLEADVLINVPVCKSHSATRASVGMKNLMGLVWDRGIYHSSDIDECLVDLLSAIRPQLTVIDGTRVLLTNGPAGPGEVKAFNTVLASADPVAADAKAITLFLGDAGIHVSDIGYIGKAEARGLGSTKGKVAVAHA
ncbi:MAG TPA: DUF362 domain-containing protein [Armatimonadota bacterium]|nr:DUF362 domain-containing protein [Armatimonadota bacterium]